MVVQRVEVGRELESLSELAHGEPFLTGEVQHADQLSARELVCRVEVHRPLELSNRLLEPARGLQVPAVLFVRAYRVGIQP